MIFDGIFEGLLCAFILTLFDFDEIVQGAVKELFNKDISESTYYLIFAILGVISNIIIKFF